MQSNKIDDLQALKEMANAPWPLNSPSRNSPSYLRAEQTEPQNNIALHILSITWYHRATCGPLGQ